MINDLIYYYEQYLTQNITESVLGASIFGSYADAIKEQRALKIFQYVIETYMKWSPEDAAVYLDYNFIQKMRLTPILSKIRFPEELDPQTDLVYVVSLIYPDRIIVDSHDKILNVYKKVLSGESVRLPKSFIAEPSGVFNACTCLQYVLQQNYIFNSVEEMYELFITPEANRILKKYRLNNVQKELFVSPLEYLHESLSESQKDEIYYHKYGLKLYEKSRKSKKASQ